MRKLILFMICLYQRYISPLFPSSCRFYPSCSEYAKQAFLKYNIMKAFILTIWRILRCNPFSKGGCDPLP
ncbi:MAG: membrane protein insertion efficiency factor YidD [Spirochaetota bacterium]|nr:membrane protein insertion efficiency factor YidD [Spirochaetota bacterium]